MPQGLVVPDVARRSAPDSAIDLPGQQERIGAAAYVLLPPTISVS